MRRLTWLLGVAAVVMIGVGIAFRLIGHDPAIWHVDPTIAERTGRQNDYVVAPSGTTQAKIDTVFQTTDLAPRDLLFLFDSIASNSARTIVVDGSVDALHITYVQQSMIFGFPDYVSVKAIDAEGGAGLVIWSRSRFGYSDTGANKARIDAWLAAMGAAGG